MDTDELFRRLLPLFEEKLKWNIEKEQRILSAQERDAERKTDLEYKKYESQLKNDRDKLEWEKEKLATTIKGQYDIQKIANQGLLDVEKIKGLNAKEISEIGYKYKIDEEKIKAVSDLFKAGQGTAIKNADGATTMTEGNPDAKAMAVSVGQQMGMDSQAAASQQQRRKPINTAEAATMIKTFLDTGDVQQATQLRSTLTPDQQKEVDATILAARPQIQPGIIPQSANQQKLGMPTTQQPSIIPPPAPAPVVEQPMPGQPQAVKPPQGATRSFLPVSPANNFMTGLGAAVAGGVSAGREALLSGAETERLQATTNPADMAKDAAGVVGKAGSDFLQGYKNKAKEEQDKRVREIRSLNKSLL